MTMYSKKLRAVRLMPDEAEWLWERSDEASAFTRPAALRTLADEVDWWGVDRSGEIIAAWPLCRTFTVGPVGPPDFSYYVGPMFARSLRATLKYGGLWSVCTASFSVLLEAIVAEHARFAFSLPLGLSDVRVLQWWNFDHPGADGFTITPRYTARIDLSEFEDENALRQSFAHDRRRCVKRWETAPPVVVDDVAAERVIELHDEAMHRTGGVPTATRHACLRRMIAVVRSGSGAIMGFVPPGADGVEAVIVLLDGPRESNNVLCVVSDRWRETGLSAWAVWTGLLRSRSMGKRWFDFNGANSPGRAADKHLYGARAELYFDCRFGPH